MDDSALNKSVSMEDVSDVRDAPPMKKFKQVCLPFKILDTKCQNKGGKNKKRKLSDQESPSAKPPKTLKQVVNNENKNRTRVVENDPEVSSSSEADHTPLKVSVKPKTVRNNILDRFVQKSTREEKEITSTIDVDVDKCGNDGVHSTSLQTPEKSLLNLKGGKLSSDKTSTPKSCNKLGFTVKKADSNTGAKDKKDTSSIEEEIVEISDGDDEKEKTDDEMDKSLDKSSSLDESKIDLSLLSSPDKSSNNGLDSSACETPKTKPKSDGSTSTPGVKRSSSKLSEKKKQERDEMRLRIKEQKEKERMEKKLQKEKEIQEKKQKLEEARLEKERLKKEEKEKKEREKQEKVEKLEKEKLEKQQQKEEEKRKKQELIDLKMEEKKKKEEEKQMKEEEKRMKEEEKKIKEEEKKREEEEKNKKEKKVKAAFERFFVKQKVPEPQPVELSASVKTCECIEIKKDTYRVSGNWRILSSSEKQNLDSLMKSTQDNCKLYLSDVKSRNYKPYKAGPEQYSQQKLHTDELIIHDSESVNKFTHHVKYIYFHTNYRPPYYGTWRKKSKKLTARNPFKMDEDLLDYEVDSDDEWEEEEPGESLSASEGEDNEEKEKEDNDEDDDGWMVPHGYLSEDECADDDKEITPEVLKDRQKAKADQWEAELKRQCQPVKTVCIGCYWTEEENNFCDRDMDILQSYAIESISSLPISTILSVDNSIDTPSRDTCQTPTSKVKAKPVPEEAIPDLVRLLHGNSLGIKKLMHEFRVYWKSTTQSKSAEETCESTSQVSHMENGESPKVLNESMKEENTPAKEDSFSVSKRQLEKKIMSIAVREKRNSYKKVCWHVNEDVLKQYDLEDLTYPNTWQYITRKNEEPANHDVSMSKIEDDANTSVCDENQTPKSLPKDQRSIMDFAKKVDHPPEILPLEKPVPVIVKPKEVKRIKPTVLSLLNNASQKCSGEAKNTSEKKVVVLVPQDKNVSTKQTADSLPPTTNHITVNTVTKQMEPMEYSEDSNGCILLD